MRYALPCGGRFFITRIQQNGSRVRIMSSYSDSEEESPPVRTVAVIGGGIAGLSCAQRLAADQIYEVTVFDKGRLRPGGRCSSRRAGDPPSQLPAPPRGILSKYTYDHAAQVVSCPTNSRHKPFLLHLDFWEERGIVTPFPKDTLFELRSFKKFQPINDLKYYYGTAEGGGIGGIAPFIVKNSCFQIKQNVFVSQKDGIAYVQKSDQWKVRGDCDGQSNIVLGMYDAVVIAHSGMGAHELLKSTPCTLTSSRMKVQFEHKLLKDGGGMLSLSSIYSLTFAIPAKDSPLSEILPPTLLSGFVRDHPVFRFITCQTRKYKSEDESIEVWTILSSPAFAKKHVAPLSENNLPKKLSTKVSRLMLLAVEEFLRGAKIWTPPDSDDEKETDGEAVEDAPPPFALEGLVLDQDLQFWPEAVPMNVFEVLRGRTPACFLYDGLYRVGVCGDWLCEANIAGAWTSGRLLAEHIMTNRNESHGLYGDFRRSLATAKAGIGMLLKEAKTE